MLVTIPRSDGDVTLDVRLLHAHVNEHRPSEGDTGMQKTRLGHALLTLIATSGNRVTVDESTYDLSQGDALLIAPGQTLSARFGKKATLLALNVHFELCRAGRAKALAALPRCVRADEDTTLLRRAMEACATSLEQGNEALARAELATALLALAKIAARRDRTKYSRHVRAALDCIRDGAEDRLTRADVADACGVSPSHLSEIVKRETGIALSDHIRRAKIDRAKELMRTTSRNFTEIAQTLGMDLYAFSRLFKKVTGTSPSAYCRAAEFGAPRRIAKQ